MTREQNIVTFLWFDNNAEEAAKFYTAIFPDSRINEVTRYGPGAMLPEGTVMTVGFELDGQEFIALNGGPQFKFTEAISLFVRCASQAEVDRLWSELTANGGEESMCGWLKDRYGLSWQIVPTALFELLRDPDRDRSSRVMEALLQMRKIDVGALERAHAGT